MPLLVSSAHTLQYYVRSTKLILPSVYDALAKGSDPDRMKGALYILWSKGIGLSTRKSFRTPMLI
jgi:proteasome activator subunit 4